MVVSSFFPGRIRIRDEVLKDEDVAAAFKAAVESHKAVNRAEYNTHTGSALVEYDTEKLPFEKFELLKNELAELKRLCDFYSRKKKQELLATIARIGGKLNS